MPRAIPTQTSQLWTARQRQMHALHYAISYRASFKPELPNYFIKKFLSSQNKRDQIVFDPFAGRGTTIIEANMLGYPAIYNDISRLAYYMSRGRRIIPHWKNLVQRIHDLSLQKEIQPTPHEIKMLSPFYHPQTMREILNLRHLIQKNIQCPEQDPELAMIGMAALSRLHGHSPGFFSTYSFPQISILPGRQKRNNEGRGVFMPEYRDVKKCLLKKLKANYQKNLPSDYHSAAKKNQYYCRDARDLGSVIAEKIDLVVTSPPFLDIVNYLQDNWLKRWFIGETLDPMLEDNSDNRPFTTAHPEKWQNFMTQILIMLGHVVKVGGHCVIEVGEVRFKKNHFFLEELVISALAQAKKIAPRRQWQIVSLLINQQKFTKLAHCWNVSNNQVGTNSNRCLILRREK